MSAPAPALLLLLLSAAAESAGADTLVRKERQDHIVATVSSTGRVEASGPHAFAADTADSAPRTAERDREAKAALGGVNSSMLAAGRTQCAKEKPRVYMYKLPARLRGDLDICRAAAKDKSVKFPGINLHGASLQTPSRCQHHKNILFELKLWSDLHGMETTQSPEDAELFLVPAFLAEMYMHKRAGRHCTFCEQRDDEIVDFLRTVGPYWDRSSGKDHLVTSLRCTKLPSTTHSDDAFPKLWGQTMRACLQELASPGAYDWLSTIKVPYFVPPASGRVMPPASRNTSVHFSGSMMPSRQWMQDAFQVVPNSDLEWFERRSSGEAKANDHLLERMSMSKFAVVPPGDTPESMRFIQAVHVGAIPVVVSDDLRYPFEDVLPWSDFVIRIPEASVHDHPDILNRTVMAKSDEELRMMQQKMLQAKASLTYGIEDGTVADLVLRSACNRLATRAT